MSIFGFKGSAAAQMGYDIAILKQIEKDDKELALKKIYNTYNDEEEGEYIPDER